MVDGESVKMKKIEFIKRIYRILIKRCMYCGGKKDTHDYLKKVMICPKCGFKGEDR